ncbi:PGF-pre-PGF domain-containing protein [Methanochimaera problematica]|nr:PGF-pre-PGF domain-containing protein [Methanoplanus sp. FWC-SCC4]
MSGRLRELGLMVLILLIIMPASVMGADIIVGNQPSDDYNALDVALQNANSGDVIYLNTTSDNEIINSTMTPGNVTLFDKDVRIDVCYSTTSVTTPWIRMNNTIAFSDAKVNFSTHVGGQVLNFWYDPDFAAGFKNNSMVMVLGNVDFNTDTTVGNTGSLKLNLTGWSGTALNITGSNNNFNLHTPGYEEKDEILGTSSIALNMSGSNNNFTIGKTLTINSTGIGVNLVGTNNFLTFNSDKITAPSGKVYLAPAATGNLVTDYMTGLSVPEFSMYNGTAYSSSNKIGYFYNSTWSVNGGNMNPTINVRNLPYFGNVSVKAVFDNVTGNSNDFVLNTSTVVNSAGIASGILFNDTASVVFANMNSEVPVKYTLGGNTIHIDLVSTDYVNEYDVGSVNIVNFNPYNSITNLNINGSYSSNWTEYTDFSAVQPSIVVDNGSVDHKLLGNLTFAENINLLDTTTISELDNLGTGIVVTNSSIYLNSALTAFNKKAVLTMYPAFAFSAVSDLVLSVTPDGGSKTTLWDGISFNSQGYLTSDTISVNTTANSTTIWTNHFSNYEFSKYVAPVTPTPTPAPTAAPVTSGGGGGNPNIGSGVAEKIDEGETAGFSVDSTAIYEVTATVNEYVPKMMVTVEKRALPRGINKLPLDVYEHDQVTVYWADETDISKGTLEFRVSKDWLKKNGYSSGDIVMFRYNEEDLVWEGLPTEYIGESGSSYLYRATTPGFSYFAIAAEKGSTMVSDEKSIKTISVVAEAEGADQTPTPVMTEDVAKTQAETAKSPVGLAPIAALLFAGLLIAIRRK